MKLNCDNYKVTNRHFWLLSSQDLPNERKTWEFKVIPFASTSSKSVQNCHLIRPWSTRNITYFLWHKSFIDVIDVIICIAIRSCIYLKLQCFGTSNLFRCRLLPAVSRLPSSISASQRSHHGRPYQTITSPIPRSPVTTPPSESESGAFWGVLMDFTSPVSEFGGEHHVQQWVPHNLHFFGIEASLLPDYRGTQAVRKCSTQKHTKSTHMYIYIQNANTLTHTETHTHTSWLSWDSSSQEVAEVFRERRSPILCDASVPSFRDNANHVTTKVRWDLRVICLNSVECGTFIYRF